MEIDNKGPDSERYLEPSRKARITLAVIAVFGLAMPVSAKLITNHLMPGQGASLKELEAAANLFGILARVTIVLAFGLMLAAAAYSGRLGYRSIKHGIFPPPGTAVVRRTLIRTGKQAYQQGYLMLLLAGAFALCAAFTIYMAIMLFSLKSI
jgi:hypothetical protein